MTEIITTRTCDLHKPAEVSWDYTAMGGCPVCEALEEVEDSLEEMREDTLRELRRIKVIGPLALSSINQLIRDLTPED